MKRTFDSLPWHDAKLLKVVIDRRDPGERDEVRLEVAWPDDGEANLLFRDCYGFAAKMNFGIVCKEQILSALVIDDDPELFVIREKWKSMGVSLNLLHCYQIETSSTASIIRIYATGFEVV